MRVKVDYRSGSRESYKNFRKEYPHRKLSYEQWKKIIYSFMYNFRDHILETGEIVKLEGGLGAFTIRKRKPTVTMLKDGTLRRYLPVDWKKSNEKGKRIYHLNYNTDGYRFKWWWLPKLATFSNKTSWTFRASRENNRLLKHYLDVDKKYQTLYKEIDINIKGI